MKLVLDDILKEEIKNYLMSQIGIKEVSLVVKDFISELNIKFDEMTMPETIIKYIYLFQDTKCSTLLNFDKCFEGEMKRLIYVDDDICCEYCYKILVQNLFENKFVKSVKSNFDFNKSVFNGNFIIEYTEDYDESQLIEYIKNNT